MALKHFIFALLLALGNSLYAGAPYVVQFQDGSWAIPVPMVATNTNNVFAGTVVTVGRVGATNISTPAGSMTTTNINSTNFNGNGAGLTNLSLAGLPSAVVTNNETQVITFNNDLLMLPSFGNGDFLALGDNNGVNAYITAFAIPPQHYFYLNAKDPTNGFLFQYNGLVPMAQITTNGTAASLVIGGPNINNPFAISIADTATLGNAKNYGYNSGLYGDASGVRGLPAQRDSMARFAPKPPMFFCAWIPWLQFATSNQVATYAQQMTTNGMLSAGYNGVWISDGWQATNRDANDLFQVNTNTGYWSVGSTTNALKSYFSYIHGLGMMNGIYTTLGQFSDHTCAGFANTPYGDEALDTRWFAIMGADSLEIDMCNGDSSALHVNKMLREFDTGILRLHPDGTDTNLSPLANNGMFTLVTDFAPLYAAYGYEQNIAEDGNDHNTTGTASDVMRQSYRFLPDRWMVHPGCYRELSWISPDPCNGASVQGTNGAMNLMSMLAIYSANLQVGQVTNPASLNIVTNPEVIAIDQNYPSIAGWPIQTNAQTSVWMKPLGITYDPTTGITNAGLSNAVAIANWNNYTTNVNVYWTNLGLNPIGLYLVRDCWGRTNIGNSTNGFTFNAPTNYIGLFLVITNQGFDFAKSVTSAQLISDYNFSIPNLATGGAIANLIDQGKSGLMLCTNFPPATNAPYQTNNTALYNGVKIAYITGQAGTGLGQYAGGGGLMQVNQPDTVFWVGTPAQGASQFVYDSTSSVERQAVFYQSATSMTQYTGAGSFSATLTLTNRYIHCNVFNGASSIYYTNGQVAATGNVGTGNSAVLAGLSVGCQYNGTQSGNCEMLRILVYSGVPSTNDFVAICNALNVLYRVTPSLPY